MYPANPDSDYPARPALDRLKAFLELTKPRITLLVLAVSIASFCLASPVFVDWPRLFLTAVGTTLLAFGVFALNHYGERDTDGMMRRTDRRPLPEKRLTPREVLSFGASLTAVAVVLICVTLGWVAGAVALFTFASYVLVYTPLKRLTPFHTALGALSGATPPLLGWAGATGALDPNAWILCGILFFWQFPHFLAIEMMYRDDYARAGIRVLPVVEPSGRAASMEMLAALVLLCAFSVGPFFTHLAGLAYLVGSALLGCLFIAAGVVVLVRNDRRAARLVLRASVVYLPVLFGLMIAAATR
jgi:protoheme IX farnesyltransferase